MVPIRKKRDNSRKSEGDKSEQKKPKKLKIAKFLVKSSLRISWKGNSDISTYEISKL